MVTARSAGCGQVNELLHKLLKSFDHQPATSSRLMRELMEKDQPAFLAAALSALRQTAGNRAYRYLIALLAGNDCLAGCVRDLAASLPAALAVARLGMQIDPTLDLTLARGLTETGENTSRSELETIRMLEILSEISDGPRLLPLLTSVLQSPNPRIRSKAALLIGRRRQSARWVAQRQEETDPRVRANAIEALWGVADENARQVLWEASQDGNNRVAGNALIGLYRLGDPRSIGKAVEMAAHPDARFRVTAAWAMGQLADPRFAAALGRMLADADGAVRGRAFQSLSGLRRRTGAQSPNGGLEVHLWAARRMADGSRRLCVATVDKNGRLPRMTGTQFLISEGERLLLDYEVRPRLEPPLLAIGFGLPRILEAESKALQHTLKECLRYRKPGQAWAMARYSLERPDTGEPPEPETPVFSTHSAAIERMCLKRVLRSESADGVLGAARVLLAAAIRTAGERHLVLVGLPQPSGVTADDPGLVGAAARRHQIQIHGVAIGGGSTPVLRALTASSGGRLLEAADEQEAQTALKRIFWGLQYRDEIHYRVEEAAAGPAVARVQVWSELGMAEDCLALQ